MGGGGRARGFQRELADSNQKGVRAGTTTTLPRQLPTSSLARLSYRNLPIQPRFEALGGTPPREGPLNRDVAVEPTAENHGVARQCAKNNPKRQERGHSPPSRAGSNGLATPTSERFHVLSIPAPSPRCFLGKV